MKNALIIMSLIAMSACATENVPVVVEVPRLSITCPDPSARSRLTETSTYRDLARSRAEAIHGWTTCSDALKISTGAGQAPAG